MTGPLVALNVQACSRLSDYLYRKAFSWLKIPQTIFIISLFLFQRKINSYNLLRKMKQTPHAKENPPGVLPYMGYIGMCRPKGYGFSAVLVINRVSILADFGHFGH